MVPHQARAGPGRAFSSVCPGRFPAPKTKKAVRRADRTILYLGFLSQIMLFLLVLSSLFYAVIPSHKKVFPLFSKLYYSKTKPPGLFFRERFLEAGADFPRWNGHGTIL